MSSQGTFDPDLYVPGDVSTYPVPAAGPGTLYQPGMYWDLLAGTWDGTPVVVGDRVYVDGRAREFGMMTFGGGIFGGPDGFDWYAEQTSWALLFASDTEWLQNPAPHSGVEIQDRWRVVVDILEQRPADEWEWVDYTTRIQSSTLRRGNTDGATTPTPVDVAQFDAIDPLGPDAIYRVEPDGQSPGTGDVIRLGLLDPSQTYHPLGTTRLARMDELHHQPDRRVMLDGFGMLMDAVQGLPTAGNWPKETAVSRLSTIFAAIEWRWAPPEFADTTGDMLTNVTGNQVPAGVATRQLLDTVAQSTGWTMRTTARGVPDFVEYPEAFVDPVLEVTDQLASLDRHRGVWTTAPTLPDDAQVGDYWTVDGYATLPSGHQVAPGDFLAWTGGEFGWVGARTGMPAATMIEYTADMAELLTEATLVHFDGTAVTVRDQAAVDDRRRGLRTAGYGLPWVDLQADSMSNLTPVAQAIVDRASALIERVRSLEVSCRADPRWLDVLAGLEIGTWLRIYRQGDTAAQLLGQVCGIEHRIGFEGDWEATIFLAGVTPAAPVSTALRTAAGQTLGTATAGDDIQAATPRRLVHG